MAQGPTARPREPPSDTTTGGTYGVYLGELCSLINIRGLHIHGALMTQSYIQEQTNQQSL